VHEAPPGHRAEHLHADAVRLDREAALDERPALSLGEDEAGRDARALAEDRHLPAVLEAIDHQVVLFSAKRPLHHAAKATALLEIGALHLEDVRPPLRMPVRVSDQLPDTLDRRLDERLLCARALHG